MPFVSFPEVVHFQLVELKNEIGVKRNLGLKLYVHFSPSSPRTCPWQWVRDLQIA